MGEKASINVVSKGIVPRCITLWLNCKFSSSQHTFFNLYCIRCSWRGLRYIGAIKHWLDDHLAEITIRNYRLFTLSFCPSWLYFRYPVYTVSLTSICFQCPSHATMEDHVLRRSFRTLKLSLEMQRYLLKPHLSIHKVHPVWSWSLFQ